MNISFSQGLQELYVKSKEAYNNKNYEDFKRLSVEALKIHPSHPAILYNLAASLSLTNNIEEGFLVLTKLLSWKSNLDYENKKDFHYILQNNEYAIELKNTKTKFSSKQTESNILAELSNEYHLEDVLYLNKKLIVTDVYKGRVILYDTENSKSYELASLKGGAMALAISESKNCFWVSSSMIPNYQNFKPENENESNLYEINWKKGEIKRVIPVPNRAIIGSMILLEGKIYATNSAKSEIIVINLNTNKVENTISIKEGYSLQGITKSNDNSSIFVADYIRGIAKFNIKESKLKWFNSDRYLLKGIDGISFINSNTLIAIQNNSYPKRVVRIKHNNFKVERVEVLDNALELNGEPTNGVFTHENQFIYIANSQWPNYDKKTNPILNKWSRQQIRVINNID